jgi:hypothetical protein
LPNRCTAITAFVCGVIDSATVGSRRRRHVDPERLRFVAISDRIHHRAAGLRIRISRTLLSRTKSTRRSPTRSRNSGRPASLTTPVAFSGSSTRRSMASSIRRIDLRFKRRRSRWARGVSSLR